MEVESELDAMFWGWDSLLRTDSMSLDIMSSQHSLLSEP